MDRSSLEELLKIEKEKVSSLESELLQVRQMVRKSNQEAITLTIDTNFQALEKTRALQESERLLREDNDLLQKTLSQKAQLLEDANRALALKINELEVSEERLSSLVSTVPDIVYRLNSNGNFTLINDAVKQLGYSPEELIGSHFTTIITPAYHSSISRLNLPEVVKKSKKGDLIKLFDERRTGKRKTKGLEVELICKVKDQPQSSISQTRNQKKYIAEVNCVGLYQEKAPGSDIHFKGTVGIIRDITERKILEHDLKQAKNNLRAKVLERTLALVKKDEEITQEVDKRIKAEGISSDAKQEWKEIFEAIGNMAFISDRNFNVKTANRVVMKTLEKPLNKIAGVKCYKLMHGTDCPITNCPVHRHKQEKQYKNQEIEININNRDYLISCTPVYNSCWELKNTIHIATDITETKQLKNELIQAQKMESMGTLAGGIAHDFNNILSIILGFSALSIRIHPEDSELSENLREIHAAGMRAKDLVQQILTFARKSDQKVHPLKVSLIAKEIIKLLRSTIPSSIHILDNISSNSYIMANPTQIHQIFMNLATNAAHSMEENGGTLEVKVRDKILQETDQPFTPPLPAGKYVEILVKDTGTGIPEENLQVVFEPYFTTKELGKGTGLGLATVHGIVKSCEGEIFARSYRDIGTSITIYLPTTRLEDAPINTFKTSPREGNEQILVVDDEPLVAKITARTLQTLGYNATYMIDSQKALKAIQNEPNKFDMVITDMTMPLLTGDKLIKEILKIRSDMPIILCTGYSSIITTETVEKLGIDGIIMKPLDKGKLSELIRTSLDKNN